MTQLRDISLRIVVTRTGTNMLRRTPRPECSPGPQAKLPAHKGALGDAALSQPTMELEFHAIAETTASRILRKRPGVVQVFLIILHEPFRLPSPNETSGAGGTEGPRRRQLRLPNSSVPG